MTQASGQPDSQRRRLLRSVYEPSSLDEVAEAVAVATEDEKRIYVERIGSAYRWSLTDPGGMYPLLRITARFLRIDYHRLVIGFRAVAESVHVLCEDPANPDEPDAWAVLYFNGVAEPTDIKARMVLALKPSRSSSRPS
ncbi:MAG: hypothetical protein ACHQC8_01685 [Solirubrobacterales bacterium]